MKGILFKPEVWQAKLRVLEEYGEAVTRRVIKPQPRRIDDAFDGTWEWKEKGHYYDDLTLYEELRSKPPYQVGETVYIKEAWATEKRYNHIRPSEIPDIAKIFYVSDGVGEWPIDLSIGRLRSALHLPGEFARYFIKITDVRAERLQEITEEDALKEGITIMAGTHQAFAKNPATNKLELIGHPEPYTARYHYESLWDSLNKDYPWESNPWVWVYTFVKLEA